jgi:hypothetical protein
VTAVWYRFAAELRVRWKSVVALALLTGIAGGVALAAEAAEPDPGLSVDVTVLLLGALGIAVAVLLLGAG